MCFLDPEDEWHATWSLGDFEDLGIDVSYIWSFSDSKCLENVKARWIYYDASTGQYVYADDKFNLTCYSTTSSKYSHVKKDTSPYEINGKDVMHCWGILHEIPQI